MGESLPTHFSNDFLLFVIIPSDFGSFRSGHATATAIVSLCTSSPTSPLYSFTACPPCFWLWAFVFFEPFPGTAPRSGRGYRFGRT
jgi:hypothetical protein